MSRCLVCLNMPEAVNFGSLVFCVELRGVPLCGCLLRSDSSSDSSDSSSLPFVAWLAALRSHLISFDLGRSCMIVCRLVLPTDRGHGHGLLDFWQGLGLAPKEGRSFDDSLTMTRSWIPEIQIPESNEHGPRLRRCCKCSLRCPKAHNSEGSRPYLRCLLLHRAERRRGGKQTKL